MAIKALTEKTVLDLSPGEHADAGVGAVGGLKLVVTHTSRTWYLRYSSPDIIDGAGKKKQRRMRLGVHPAMSVADARRTAVATLAKINSGVDPMEQVKQRKSDIVTVADMVERYRAVHVSKLRPKTADEINRQLDRHLLQPFGATRVEKMNESILRHVWEEIEADGHAAMAKSVFGTLRHLFKFARGRGWITSNPMIELTFSAKIVAKDRNLSPKEIRAFWHGLDNIPIDKSTRIALRLLLLTGQRSGELLGTKEEDLDLDTDLPVWRISKERTKNKQPHEVPLTPMAVELFREAIALARRKHGGASTLIWPSRPRTKVGNRDEFVPTDGTTLRRPMARHHEALGLDVKATPHDLRRTLATRMIEIGILPHVVEYVLNHISGARAGVAGTYNRAQMSEPMRAAIMGYERDLRRICGLLEEESNAVKLHV
ncbi:MAG: tyrosine-type recombinase/integrase [Hoeflea sp. D1-CHI-28]|uniref:tyrosine-type recombinase/integrase n=1 Tax=Hoeflea sp. TaxID=1940281 RepID=UPI0032EBAA88